MSWDRFGLPLLSFLACLGCFPSSNLMGANPTPAELDTRQQAAVDQIKSLKVKASSKIDFEGTDPIERQTKTILKGSTVLIQEGTVGKQVVERLTDGNQSRVLQRIWDRGKIKFSAVINPANSSAGTSDLFTFIHFKYFKEGDGNSAITPFDFFRREDMKFRVYRDEWNGRKCYRIDGDYAQEGTDIDVSYWLDDGYGYLVTRCLKTTRRNGATISKYEATMSDWHTAGAAYFPMPIDTRQFKGDALQCTHTTACSDLEINGPVGDAELKLPAIPDGTECRDNRTMKRYALAPDWSRSGPEHDYAVMKVANPNGNAETLDAFVGVTTDSGERRSVWTWIAIVSGGLLIIALFVNVRRKRRLGNLED